MAPSPRPWSIAFVEDDDDMRRQVKEYLEGETFTFGKVEVAETGSFDEALALLRERKIDLVILDVFRGGTGRGDKAGIRVLEDWRATGFAPVILHTALPEGLNEHCSVFVRLVAKEGGSLPKLVKAIEELFALKIPQVHRAIFDHLEASLRDYMWDFVVTNWKDIGNLVVKSDFIHLLVRRLALQFARIGVGTMVEQLYPGTPGGDPEPDKVHPVEYYIKPPLGPDPQLGDIRILPREGKDKYLVVVWPSCDLVERKGACRVERAVCALASPVEESKEYEKWSGQKPPSNTATKDLEALLSNNRSGGQPERYFFLPAAWDIPHLVIDFNALEPVEMADLRASRCVATVASPFAESMAARLVRYLGRVGTPDLDLDIVLEALRPKIPEPEAQIVAAKER